MNNICNIKPYKQTELTIRVGGCTRAHRSNYDIPSPTNREVNHFSPLTSASRNTATTQTNTTVLYENCFQKNDVSLGNNKEKVNV